MEALEIHVYRKADLLGSILISFSSFDILYYPEYRTLIAAALARHPYCERTTLDDSNLRGPVTLKPVAERLAVELSLPFLKT